MRIRRLRWLLPTLLLLAVLWPSPAGSSAVAATEKPPSKLELQIATWVDSLSKQKPFAEWHGADPQIEALGPGTHSWLVLFSREGRHIGYMVVNAVMDGTFKLGEYGLGDFPLFSYDLLRESLVNGGFITSDDPSPPLVTKRYVHPFAAAWEVTIGPDTYWFDAKTAEQLPIDAESYAELFPKTYEALPDVGAADAVGKLRLIPAYDVYERIPWLTKETPFPAKEASKLEARLDDKQHLRYITEPFGDRMLYAAAVVGYLRWSGGRVDVALDMAGERFIPLSTLREDGLFYR